jgi:osmoprotectant transport system permease protein
MLAYWNRYHGRLLTALTEHLSIVGIVLLISVVFAFLITFLVMRRKRLSELTVRIFGAVYAIPSLALFAILIPFLGIGRTTAIFVLVLYNQFLLIRNFLAGFALIDPIVTEAARGMGLTNAQILLKIQFPLAFPAIIAGVHLATVSTIGIATIAAVINAGGIGTVLFDGLRTLNTAKILWGTVLSGVLAITANTLFGFLEKYMKKRLHYAEEAEGE